MKYIRFQSQLINRGTPSKLGIFQTAYRVRDAHATRVHDANEINRHINWLKTHLRSPDLDDARDFRAIFWFKDTAHEPMKRIWAIKPYLEAHGHWIDVVKTSNPGQIIYRDGWQVAARPLR